MKKRIFIQILGVFLLGLSACSSEKEAPEPIEVTIEMSEYAFSPADLNFEVGQEVTILLKNVGVLDHEIMFGQDVMMNDGRPNGYKIDLFETAGVEPMVMMMEGEMEDEHEEGEDHEEDMDMEEDHMEHTGFMVMVPPESGDHTIQFTVTEEMVGEWEIGCFELLGVHYDSGMFGTMVITN